jgi:hypothetical protein
MHGSVAHAPYPYLTFDVTDCTGEAPTNNSAITKSTLRRDTESGTMVSNLVSVLDAVEPSRFATDAERFAVKEAARRLLARIETPFEQGWAIAFENPGAFAAIQLVQDLGIWTKWAEADQQSPGAAKTLDELLGWAKTTCEPNLLRRFLRHVAALYLIQEDGVDSWKPTPFSLALGTKDTYGADIIKAG